MAAGTGTGPGLGADTGAPGGGDIYNRLIDEGVVAFAGSAASGATATAALRQPTWTHSDQRGKFLFWMWVEAALGVEVGADFYHRRTIPSGPGTVYAKMDVPQGSGGGSGGGSSHTLEADAGAGASLVVEGLLLAEDPGQVQFTLTGAGSATGGRVWWAVYSL